MFKMILAVDQDNAIGNLDGSLPWRLRDDLRRFKELTEGHVVVMGRRTFESFKGLNLLYGLPNRMNYVLTSSPDDIQKFVRTKADGSVSGVQAITSLDQAPEGAWIVGGATLYDQVINAGLVDHIELTLVHTQTHADVKLKHNLYNLGKFVSDNPGWSYSVISWSNQSLRDGDDRHFYSFVTLKKEKEKDVFSKSHKGFDSSLEAGVVLSCAKLEFSGCLLMAASGEVTTLNGQKLTIAAGAELTIDNITVSDLVVERDAKLKFNTITAKNVTLNGGTLTGGTVSYDALAISPQAKLNATLIQSLTEIPVAQKV